MHVARQEEGEKERRRYEQTQMQTHIGHSSKHAHMGIAHNTQASQQGGVAVYTMKKERGWEERHAWDRCE